MIFNGDEQCTSVFRGTLTLSNPDLQFSASELLESSEIRCLPWNLCLNSKNSVDSGNYLTFYSMGSHSLKGVKRSQVLTSVC